MSVKMPALTLTDRRARLTEKASGGQHLESAVREKDKATRTSALVASGASPAELRRTAAALGTKGAAWKTILTTLLSGKGLRISGNYPAIIRDTHRSGLKEGLSSAVSHGAGAVIVAFFTTMTTLAVNSTVNRLQARGLKNSFLQAAQMLEAQGRSPVSVASPAGLAPGMRPWADSSPELVMPKGPPPPASPTAAASGAPTAEAAASGSRRG